MFGRKTHEASWLPVGLAWPEPAVASLLFSSFRSAFAARLVTRRLTRPTDYQTLTKTCGRRAGDASLASW